MNKRDFQKAQAREFDVEKESEGIRIEDIELEEPLDELFEDMAEDLLDTDCPHCQINILKLAILYASDITERKVKYGIMKDIHCSMTDCDECDGCE